MKRIIFILLASAMCMGPAMAMDGPWNPNEYSGTFRGYGDFLPGGNGVYDLGDPGNHWRKAYIDSLIGGVLVGYADSSHRADSLLYGATYHPGTSFFRSDVWDTGVSPTFTGMTTIDSLTGTDIFGYYYRGHHLSISTPSLDSTGTVRNNTISSTFSPTTKGSNVFYNAYLNLNYDGTADSTSAINSLGAEVHTYGSGWIGQTTAGNFRVIWDNEYLLGGQSVYMLRTGIEMNNDAGEMEHAIGWKADQPNYNGTARPRYLYGGYIANQPGATIDGAAIHFEGCGPRNSLSFGNYGSSPISKIFSDSAAGARIIFLDPDSLTKLVGASVTDTFYFHRMFGRDGDTTASIGTDQDNGMLQIWSIYGYYSYLRPRSNTGEGYVGNSDYHYGHGWIDTIHTKNILPPVGAENTGSIGSAANAFDRIHGDSLFAGDSLVISKSGTKTKAMIDTLSTRAIITSYKADLGKSMVFGYGSSGCQLTGSDALNFWNIASATSTGIVFNAGKAITADTMKPGKAIVTDSTAYALKRIFLRNDSLFFVVNTDTFRVVKK